MAVAIATGTLVVVAYGGFAMASEFEEPSDPVVVVTTTAEPDEPSDEDAPEDDAPSTDEPSTDAKGGGLVCVLVPIEPVEGEPVEEETVEGEPAEGDPADDEPTAIEQLLEENTIECSGTGNERSADVALVPRYLAHSDELTGAEKGAAISAWAKTHANKKSADDEDVDGDEETSGDVDKSKTVKPASPGRSGDAPGRSGTHPGNGKGH